MMVTEPMWKACWMREREEEKRATRRTSSASLAFSGRARREQVGMRRGHGRPLSGGRGRGRTPRRTRGKQRRTFPSWRRKSRRREGSREGGHHQPRPWKHAGGGRNGGRCGTWDRGISTFIFSNNSKYDKNNIFCFKDYFMVLLGFPSIGHVSDSRRVTPLRKRCFTALSFLFFYFFYVLPYSHNLV